MKFFFVLFFCFHLFLFANAQQKGHRPKIGLTLSGGGAKGLAHIGILKAIDSAGLKIDYITGTSMGAVIGSLYAIGYSGDQIEKIAKSMDWDLLLSNQLSLRSLSMEEKDEYGRYAVELPFINNKPQLPGGILDGQELWFKFASLYYPVHNIKNFSKFSIPFKCIATNISNGNAVVFDTGEIITAVRASMAIPSVFAPVKYHGVSLVDGGVVRNFPVTDVKKMGADYIIGSTVTKGLFPQEKLNSPVDILLQLVFLREADDYKKEVPLCNLFISQPLEKYTMGSFNKADQLIELGDIEGRKLYPYFKKLADSLNNIYGTEKIDSSRLPKSVSVFISSYKIIGLNKTTETYFIHAMDFHVNKWYSKSDIAKAVRKVFGTRYYRSINYSLEPQPNGSSEIIFRVQENPSTYIKLGLHYNDFTGISVIGNFTTRDFFTPYSRSLLSVNVGENFGLKGEHLQYFGNNKNIALIPKFQVESFKINNYDNFHKTGQYRLINSEGEIRSEYSGSRNFTAGIGSRYEWKNFKPLIQSQLDAGGNNTFLNSFLYFEVNTLNKKLYPTKGLKINAEFGFVYNQTQDVTFYSNGGPITNTDSADIHYDNYQRMWLTAESYLPVTRKLTFYTMFQSGINFNYRQNLLDNFQIGGLTRTMENQIIFAGLNETTVNAPSVAALMIGFNYQLSKNIYLIAKSNALVNNFISADHHLQFNKWLSGHALTFAYNTPIGPLELSLTYSDDSKQVLSYVNFGIPF
ncbi:MAG TPA: patatin-like phospholipase family protein [Hanamia sp.]|nr:patatin-like phospholipase family protein [Hanamia sp.]